jgi:hypothetical protein
MASETDPLREQIASLQGDVAAFRRSYAGLRIRMRSSFCVAGLPLYDIAIGPDFEKGEMRGKARGIIAIGDIAMGVFAFGGLAVGAISVGGCSLGLLCGIGGLSVGLLAIGGVAIGAVAVGGVAVGFVAVGGCALGYYACGGVAFGKFVISGMHQDPEAIRFFHSWIPGIDQLMNAAGR